MAYKRTREGDAIQQQQQQQQHFCCVCISTEPSILESLLRRIVREELELHRSPRQSGASNQTRTSEAKPFRLCFTTKLQDTYYTNSKIVSAEDDVPVKIALYDVTSQSIVTDGRLSSLKIEICVLSDFGSDNGTEENWTSDEFSANILVRREGKAPILSGERFITLENGESSINKMFTDNSSWTRNRKFRLGARAVKPSDIEANIREAISDPVRVKDYRGKARKRPDRLSLNDYVWCLRNIAKDGKIHKWLSSQEIHTVKDLLRFNTINPSSFKKKYGDVSTRTWEKILENAKDCAIDEKERYIYRTAEQPMTLLFNSIFKVVEVAPDGQNYCPPDSLTWEQKLLLEKVKLDAYKNKSNIVPFDETPALNFSKPFSSPLAGPSGAAHQCPDGFNEYSQEDLMEMLRYSPPIGGGFSSPAMRTELGDVWSPSGWEIPLPNSSFPCAIPMGQGSTGFYIADGAECSNAQYSCFANYALHVQNNGKHKAVWRKIRTTLKWVISVRLKRRNSHK